MSKNLLRIRQEQVEDETALISAARSGFDFKARVHGGENLVDPVNPVERSSGSNIK
jgi:hypothetical protein